MQKDSISLSTKISLDANHLIDKFLSNDPAIQELREKGITVNKHTISRSGLLLIVSKPELITEKIAMASQNEEGFDNAICGEI